MAQKAGPPLILDAIRNRWPWFRPLVADDARDRRRPMDRAAFPDSVIEVVRRIEGDPGFKALPRRPVVEQAFARLTRRRRLVRDYERRIGVSDAMIHAPWETCRRAGPTIETALKHTLRL